MYLSKDAYTHVREIMSAGAALNRRSWGFSCGRFTWPGHNPTSEVPDFPVLPRPGGSF